MRKIVLVLNDVVGDKACEAHFRIPTEIADKLDMKHLEIALRGVFGDGGVDVLSIEKVEECRTSLNRRWDDVKPMKDGGSHIHGPFSSVEELMESLNAPD